jgi:integrase
MSAHKMAHMRGRGEGSIYRRADGYWVGAVEAGRTGAGKRRRVRVVRRRRADVLAEMDRLRRAARSGVTDQHQYVGAYLTWWIEEVKAGTIAPKTLRNYRAQARLWIGPHIGRVRLAKLRVTHVQSMVNELRRQGLSPRVVNQTLKLVRQVLKHAVGARVLDHNPAEHVRSVPVSNGADVAMTAQEARAVLGVAGGDQLYALWWLALKYGLRIGELLDLRWADIDDDELHVRRSKTAAGMRTLPLIPEAKRVLRDHRRSGAAGRTTRVASIEGYVFCRPDGRPIDERRIGERWAELLQQAGVEHRRFHSTRHTALTLLLEDGVPLEIVSAIAGHSSISVTADIYARVRSDLIRKGLAKLDEIER